MIRNLKLKFMLFMLINGFLCQELPKLNPISLPGHLKVNDRAKLLCVASSGDQPIIFHWLKDGKILDFGQMEQLDEWTFSLTIDPLILKHIGNYTCRASNNVGNEQVTAYLFVTAPPQWIHEPSDLRVREGKNSMFHCQADGSPKVKVMWSKQSESQKLTPILSSGHFHVYENGSFQISNAQKANSGIYICEISNGVGSNLQKSVQLIVYDYPHVERITDHVVVERGQTARIACSAKGDPPLSFSWMKSLRPLEEWPQIAKRTSFSDVLDNGRVNFSITITHTESDDEGLYSCIANNEFGSDRKDVRLMLVERPESPQFIELVDIWSRSVRIRWSTPDNGNSPILSYTVEYWTNPGGHWNLSTSSSSSSCILRHLKPNTVYNFHVWASNNVGDSKPSERGQFTTAKEEPTAPPVDIRIEDVGSSFVRLSWKPPPQEDWHGDLLGYYVGFKQGSSGPFTYNTVEADEIGQYHYVLRGLHRATRYLATVRAFNEVGSGPQSEEISFKTQNQEPLPQPILMVQDIGSTYIQINWMIPDEIKKSTAAFTLLYRRMGKSWVEVNIPDPYQTAFTLTNLDSGVPYQVYITSHGTTGISEPSEIATVRTSPETIYHPAVVSTPQPEMDELTQALYVVVPVAISSVLIVIVIVIACVYVYSRRPVLPSPHIYGDLPASKNFSYMSTVPRTREIPVTIGSGNVIKFGSPYSTVPLTRPEHDDDEPIYESVVGDTLRKMRERCFDDDFKVGNATIV